MKRRTLLAFSAVLASTAAAWQPAWAQGFPSQPVTMVVPFPAGGITDTVARALAQKMAADLGQPVVVSNNPGGGGQIAASRVLQAPADGHTVFVGATEMFAINPTLFRQFSYDPIKDFTPVTSLIKSPLLLVVPANSPIQSVDQLIERAKSGSGLNFGSQGVGSIGHLLGEQFRQKAGGAYNHIAYRGSAPALQDLIGGQTDFMFDPIITTDPFIKTGRLKALAIAAPERAPQMPEVPTLKELGIEGVDSGVWFGMVARAGTPEAVVARLNKATLTAMQDPEVRERFDLQGMQAFPSTPAGFGAFLQSEQARWAPLVKSSGASVD